MTVYAIRGRALIRGGLLWAFGALLLVLGLVALYVVQPYFGSENSDSEFGYYGQYNRVKHILEAMPNVMIVARWQHEDLTLEDFGFTLLRDGTRLVQVNVHEASLEMRTRRKGRLRELLQKQIDANQPPEEWQKGLFPDEYYEKSPELKAWRQTQPDPVPPQPIAPKPRMLTRRKLPPGESLPSPIDANQPAGEPAESRPTTTVPPDPAARSTPREP